MVAAIELRGPPAAVVAVRCAVDAPTVGSVEWYIVLSRGGLTQDISLNISEPSDNPRSNHGSSKCNPRAG